MNVASVVKVAVFLSAYLLWTAVPPSIHFVVHSPERVVCRTQITAFVPSAQPPVQRGGHPAAAGGHPLLLTPLGAPSGTVPAGDVAEVGGCVG